MTNRKGFSPFYFEMKEYTNIFISHFLKYPNMLPDDFFKLIYQNSHGPHHLNIEFLESNFINELNMLNDEPKIKQEYIGNEYTRIYLNPKWTDLEKQSILNAFIKSNQDYNPNPLLLQKELECLKALVLNKMINFDISTFLEVLEKFRENPKPLSHSKIYKDSYNPHYVVIHNKYLQQNTIMVNHEKK